MTTKTPVRIASITKTLVAAAVLRLMEEDRLDLDAPIADFISEAHNESLKADGYDTDAITIRHLLMHSGGLADHAQTDAFLMQVVSDQDRVWTRTDQLNLMVTETEPLSVPGAEYHYSDTGYILIGEIIERVTGKALSEAVRELNRFDALNLDMVWEGEPTKRTRAVQFYEGININGIHGSMDAFGGGGIIASTDAMTQYFRALFSGKIFASPETLELMKTAPGHPENSPYRIGLFVHKIEGLATYGHGGFWGTEAFAVPDADIVISGVVLDQTALSDLREVMEEIVAERVRN